MSRILLSVPHMGGLEQGFVAEAFASNWMSTVGPNVTAFEQEFGARLGVTAVALTSGTVIFTWCGDDGPGETRSAASGSCPRIR